MSNSRAMTKIKEVYNKMKEEKANEVEDREISMTVEEFIDEHKNLIRVLRSGDKKALESEARKQERELKDKTGLTESDDTGADE